MLRVTECLDYFRTPNQTPPGLPRWFIGFCTRCAIFRLVQNGVVITESGVPSVSRLGLPRIYVDTTAGHDTGIATHNTDNGDGWEREQEFQYFFREFSEKRAYPLGINILVYPMTH